MTKVKLKSGGHVNILSNGQPRITGEICFLKEEYEWAQKLSKDLSDPEAEREFWKNVLEKKQKDPLYNVFNDFPRNLADIYAPVIIAGLKGKKTGTA